MRSNCDGGFDGGVGIVAYDFDVFVAKGFPIGNGWIEPEFGQSAGLALQLGAHLIEVVDIQMDVPKGVDKIADLVAAHLCQHMGEEGIRGDVERNAEEQIGTALIQLTAEFAFGYVELKEHVTGWQRHPFNFGYVPGTHDMPAAVGVVFEPVHQSFNLIDVETIGGWPASPLGSIHGSQFAILVGPFVPDAHPVFFEVGDVGGAFEEPQQLVYDGLEVEFFGRDQRKALAEIKPQLVTEHA